jgi:hypothetical protein
MRIRTPSSLTRRAERTGSMSPNMRIDAHSRDSRPAILVALALLPMGGALAGAFVDEQSRLGVTVWLSACRASGFAFSSIVTFTFELLPNAVIGALAGGLVVLAFAFGASSAAGARASLAAHLGCAAAMPVGLLLCALALPLPLMLAADALLAGGAALALRRALEPVRATHACVTRVPA